MINSMIYAQATKDKVIKPSQWKDDMYITLKWECPSCGKTYLKCDCEGSRETFKPTLERDNDFDPEFDTLDDDDYCRGCGNVLACCECD